MTSFAAEAAQQQELTFESTSRYAQVREDMRLHITSRHRQRRGGGAPAVAVRTQLVNFSEHSVWRDTFTYRRRPAGIRR
jgi:hypothetical protein